MPDTIYTTNPPTGSPDTIHYYKTCPRLQTSPQAWDKADIDTGTMEVCGDCRERFEYNRKQHIGKTGPARQLVDASPDDYPLKTDGGETADRESAQKPVLLESITRKMRAFGGDYADMADQSDWLWENPIAYANGEATDFDDPPFDHDLYVAFMFGVNFGVSYEMAYPTNERADWPVSLEERGHDAE